MMKASEPRTFSWISTKISMAAKRRTTALVSGSLSPLAMACARAGLELPATSLIEPFLADIEASPRVLLDTTFSISQFPRNKRSYRVSISEVISRGWPRWQPVGTVFPGKMAISAAIWLMAGVAERADAPFSRSRRGLIGARDRRSAFGRRGRRGRIRRSRPVDEAAQPAQSGLRDFPQNQVVGGGPGVAPGLARGLLAGKAQRALLVLVIDVPDPGDDGAAAVHLGCEITAHPVRSGALAGHDREAAKFGFAVEHADHPLEHLRRRPVDGFECNGGAARGARHRKRAAGRAGAGTAAEPASHDQQSGGDCAARRQPAGLEQSN